LTIRLSGSVALIIGIESSVSEQARTIGFVWDQCCDYHMDRAEALARAMGDGGRVVLFEVASRSLVNDWPECRSSAVVERITLFPGKVCEEVGEIATAWALLRAILQSGARNVFLCGYEHPGRFAVAAVLKLLGRPLVLLLDSKFEDKPRRKRLELFKHLVLLPYRAAFASGARAQAYLRWLGMRKRPVVTGVDTVSLARMRSLGGEARPDWPDRPFLQVGRLIPKKNVAVTLRAFAAMGETRRSLRICGDGPLRGELEQLASALGISERVVWLGNVSQAVVAREMAGALCLLLPSVEEQWGLVVNEALAFDLPVLAGENVGARDMLIANHVNGWLLDPDEIGAWSAAMQALGSDEALWRRFSQGSRERAPLADVDQFVAGTLALLR
jgi:L-malate glycosyltransferase